MKKLAAQMLQNAFRSLCEPKDARIVLFGLLDCEKLIPCTEGKKFDDHLKLAKDKHGG